MERLEKNIDELIRAMSGDSDQARIAYRAHQVRNRYRLALEKVYRSTADLFLAHTNNVYLMKKDGVPTLIVYVDESLFAAELNAQRELIRLKLLELFGEEVEQFEIYVSRGNYRNYHPYVAASPEGAPPAMLDTAPLGGDDRRTVEDASSMVEDETLRKALEKAMTADIKRKNAENGIRT